MILRVGQALMSTVDATSVMVTHAPAEDVQLTCGGVEMTAKKGATASEPPDPAQMNGTLIGKRYIDPASGLELLCMKAGEGSLAIDGRPLEIAQPKNLPSSD